METKNKKTNCNNEDKKKEIRRELITKNEGLEYYMVYYDNGESEMDVILIQPSWDELSYCQRMPKLGF